MRRSVTVYLIVALICCGAAILFQQAENNTHAARYHQHLSEPSEEALAADEAAGASVSTHLPLIRIDTSSPDIPGRPITDETGHTVAYETAENGESQILARFEIVDTSGQWHHDTDAPDQTGTAYLRYRGNSSRWFSKGSFRLRIASEDGEESEAPLMGMKSGRDWALYGPFLDKTLIRNYLWMNIAGEIMPDWTPEVRFCELILNGEYQGLYVMMEMIEVQKNRLYLTKYDDGDLIPSYLVRIEPKTNPDRELEDFAFYSYRMEEDRNFELLYPGLSHQNEHVLNYVETDLSEIERKIYAAEVSDGSHEWKDVLDMESFVDYYILEEFAGIIDTFSASTYFYKDTRGKLKIGPVWDFNNASDNFFQPVACEGFLVANRGWYGQLMHDQEFVSRVVSRYRQLRKTVLSDEYLTRYVQETETWLGSAVDRNWEVWGYSFDTSSLDPHERRSAAEGNSENLEAYNPADYREANEWMLDYMLKRAHWLDENIETLYQFAHESKFSGKAID